jgi:hypothetical protein
MSSVGVGCGGVLRCSLFSERRQCDSLRRDRDDGILVALATVIQLAHFPKLKIEECGLRSWWSQSQRAQ